MTLTGSEIKLAALRHLQSLLFMAVLALNCLSSNLFVMVVHFRALSGWEDEMFFDSLTFNWHLVDMVLLFLNGGALTGVFFGFFEKGFYRLYGWAVALVFLLNTVYPWGLAFHYVRTFHFILLFGIVVNAYGFLVLAFFKGTLGLDGNLSNSDGENAGL